MYLTVIKIWKLKKRKKKEEDRLIGGFFTAKQKRFFRMYRIVYDKNIISTFVTQRIINTTFNLLYRRHTTTPEIPKIDAVCTILFDFESKTWGSVTYSYNAINWWRESKLPFSMVRSGCATGCYNCLRARREIVMAWWGRGTNTEPELDCPQWGNVSN